MISTYTREYVYNHLTYVVIPKLNDSLEEVLQDERNNHQRNLEWYAASWWNRFFATPPVLDLVLVENEFNTYKQRMIDMAEQMLQGHQSYISFNETEVWLYKLNDTAVVAIGE